MKRAVSYGTRRGSPPLPRQRKALRVVQLTFIGIALACGLLAFNGWRVMNGMPPLSGLLGEAGSSGSGEMVALVLCSTLFLLLSLAMGVRIVRGPEPPRPN